MFRSARWRSSSTSTSGPAAAAAVSLDSISARFGRPAADGLRERLVGDERLLLAPAVEDRRPRRTRLGREAGCQARLADPGFAGEQHDLRRPTAGGDTAPGGADPRQLAAAADELRAGRRAAAVPGRPSSAPRRSPVAASRRAPASRRTAPSSGGSGAGCAARRTRPARPRDRRRPRGGASARGESPPRAARARPGAGSGRPHGGCRRHARRSPASVSSAATVRSR